MSWQSIFMQNILVDPKNTTRVEICPEITIFNNLLLRVRVVKVVRMVRMVNVVRVRLSAILKWLSE